MLKKTSARKRRHTSLRRKVGGSSAVPRLAVFRSNRHIYAQLIDDETGTTLAAASSLDAAVERGSKGEVAQRVGKLAGERAKQAGITKAVFDRGGFKYQGRVAQVASGARDAGLEF